MMPTLTTRDRYIIAARVEGYIGNHSASVALLTDALAQFPDDIRLLRHRGHRRISVRDYAGAIEDLTAAAALLDGTDDELELYQKHVEPEGMRLIVGLDPQFDHHPKVAEMADDPVADEYSTTLHTSVWYHLGVAQYLVGDYEAVVETFTKAHATARHYEGLVASLDWKYMALRRLGRNDEAAEVLQRFRALADDNDITGIGYADRLRLYTGEIDADELRRRVSDNQLLTATVGYGLGNWYLCEGDTESATAVFESVIATGAKYAFAYMAAEAELAAA